MPTPYEKSYGSVKFYEPDGTAIFDTEDDLGLWTSVDEEPSPDPKWVRVDVPGADGAVDLSRALAGQVTYEMREITLGFVGSCADHAAALALVRQMRSALHGARVRVETVLTARIGGYYVADCECDGTAYAGGEVEIEVRAWADPFIRVGTQTLTLPRTTSIVTDEKSRVTVPVPFARGVGKLVATAYHGANTYASPLNATTARLWYARETGEGKINLLDLANVGVTGFDNAGTGGDVHASDVFATGQVINVGALVESHYKSVMLTPYRRGASGYAPDCSTVGVPLISASGYVYTNIGIYLSGTIDSVSSPSIKLVRYRSTSQVDQYGVPTSSTSGDVDVTMEGTLAAGSYDGTLIASVLALSSDTEIVNALALKFNGIESASGLKMQLVAIPSTYSLPQVWQEPVVGYVNVTLGGTFCRTTTDGDVATVSQTGVAVAHNCALSADGFTAVDLDEPFDTAGSVGGWIPLDAKQVSFCATNAFGEDCPIATSKVSTYAVGTATATNQTMRSTPTVTSSGGMLLSIGGRDAIVGAGTQAVPSLTIPGGSFVAKYATFDGTNATMTWEGGVL